MPLEILHCCHATIHSVSWDAASLPEEERLASRPTKPGTLDLTAGKLFIQREEGHQKLVSLAQKYAPDVTVAYGNESAQLFAHVVLRILLQALRSLHTLWRVKSLLTDQEVTQYRINLGRFRDAWVALQWPLYGCTGSFAIPCISLKNTVPCMPSQLYLVNAGTNPSRLTLGTVSMVGK